MKRARLTLTPTMLYRPPAATRLALWLCGVMALAGMAGVAPGHAEVADTLEAMQEKVLGHSDAPVTLIEYSSLTCPHCRHFHLEILPTLKERFIDTGKVKLIYRDFPLDLFALRASMLARCAGNARFFAFLNVLFQEQFHWATAEDPLIALLNLARLGGFSGQDFKQCVGNQGLEDAILQQRLDGYKTYDIKATPTLVINGAPFDGAFTLDDLTDAIEASLASASP